MQSFVFRVCVCARERERVTVQHRVCERGRHGHTTAACVQTHTSFITLFPSQILTDGKTKDIINCLYIYFES